MADPAVKLTKAYRLKLYPNDEQAQRFTRHAGACRWLWNYLLAMQKDRHKESGTFAFFNDMSKMLPALKREHPWLAEAPSNALVRVAKNLDRALRDSFAAGRGFPRFKKRGVSRDSYYVIGQAVRVEGGRVLLPKSGRIRFRSGRSPEGRILGGSVTRIAGGWVATLRCDVDAERISVSPVAETVIGVDFGLAELMVASDGVRVAAPRHLRAAQKRLRRAQRVLARRKKGSANRARQARRVAVLHQRVVDRRLDVTHKATRALVDRASAVVTENPNIKGMMGNPRLAFSFADAGWGEALRQISYKCAWQGKTHHRVGRFEPSTQTCSSCGAMKTGADKLRLHQRTFRCICGAAIDRDANAALNLRRLGVRALCANEPIVLTTDVGRVTPERAGTVPVDACGDPSAGLVPNGMGRCGSQKQEGATLSNRRRAVTIDALKDEGDGHV